MSLNVVRAVPLGVGAGGFAGSTGKPQRCAPRLLEKPLPEGEEKTGFGPGPPQEESALHGSLDPPQNEPVPGGRPPPCSRVKVDPMTDPCPRGMSYGIGRGRRLRNRRILFLVPIAPARWSRKEEE